MSINIDDLDRLQHDVLTGSLSGFQLRDICEALINECKHLRREAHDGR